MQEVWDLLMQPCFRGSEFRGSGFRVLGFRGFVIALHKV